MHKNYLTRLLCSLVVSLCCVCPAFAEEGWETNFEKAKQLAAAANKDLLVNFTGSDWCMPCKKLEVQVFGDAGFNGSEHFVLVLLDFPRDNSKMPAALVEQNADLQQRYYVTGFPTVLLMDAQGQPYAKTGFRRGGVELYNEHLLALKEQKGLRDQAFADVDNLKTPAEQAAKIIEGFEAMPGVDPKFYADKLKLVMQHAPDSEFLKERDREPERETQEQRVERYKREIAEGDLSGEELQQALFGIDRYAVYETLEEETQALQKAMDAAPLSRLGRAIKKQLQDLKRLKTNKGKVVEGWESDLDKAKAKAAASGKDLFVVFASGGAEVNHGLFQFVTDPGFNHEDELICVWLDMPTSWRLSKSKTFLAHTEMLTKAKEDYSAKRYPVTYLMEADGIPYARTLEYASKKNTEPSAYAQHLQVLLKQKSARDRAFSAADALPTGEAKAQQLLAGFEAMPNLQPWFYPQRVEQLRELLAEDDWFFRLRAVSRNSSPRAENELIVARLKKEIEQNNPQGEALQVKLIIIHWKTRHESPEAELAEWQRIIALEPDSRHAQICRQSIEKLKARQAAKGQPLHESKNVESGGGPSAE